jgi:hypothetical protein
VSSTYLKHSVGKREHCDVLIADVPDAFFQTEINTGDSRKRIIMKIRGFLVDMLVELDPEKYSPFVKLSNGKENYFCGDDESSIQYASISITVL